MQVPTTIAQIMTRHPQTVGSYDTMETVRTLLEERGYHHIPVVDQGELVGIVTYTDYLGLVRTVFDNLNEARANERLLHATLVREVMTTPVLSLGPDEPIEAALRIFKTNHFHSIPVIDEKRHLLGIVTTYDMMKVLERMYVNG